MEQPQNSRPAINVIKSDQYDSQDLKYKPYVPTSQQDRPRYYDPTFQREGDQQTKAPKFEPYTRANYQPTNYTPANQYQQEAKALSPPKSQPLVKSQILTQSPIQQAVPLNPVSHIVPGGQMPFQMMPGMQMPGMQMPGMQMPGMQMPGMQMPGMQMMPGMQVPGIQMQGMQRPELYMSGIHGQMQVPGYMNPMEFQGAINAQQYFLHQRPLAQGQGMNAHQMPATNPLAGSQIHSLPMMHPGLGLATSQADLQNEIHTHYEPVETKYIEYQTVKRVIQVPVTEEIIEYVPVGHEMSMIPMTQPIIHRPPSPPKAIYHRQPSPPKVVNNQFQLKNTYAQNLNQQRPSINNSPYRNPGITHNAKTLVHPLSNRPYTDQFTSRNNRHYERN